MNKKSDLKSLFRFSKKLAAKLDAIEIPAEPDSSLSTCERIALRMVWDWECLDKWEATIRENFEEGLEPLLEIIAKGKREAMDILVPLEHAFESVKSGDSYKAMGFAYYAGICTSEHVFSPAAFLSEGRKLGAAARQAKAASNAGIRDKAIDDLYKNGIGYQWTYEKIADYLMDYLLDQKDKNKPMYEKSTLLAYLKRHGKEFKEKHQ